MNLNYIKIITIYSLVSRLLTGAINPNVEKHNAPINSMSGDIFGTAIAMRITPKTRIVLEMKEKLKIFN